MGVRDGCVKSHLGRWRAAVVLCAVVVTVGCRRSALDRDGGAVGDGGLGAIGGPAGVGGIGGSAGEPGWGGFGGSAVGGGSGGTPVSPRESRTWTWKPCGTIPGVTEKSPRFVGAEFAPDGRELATFWNGGRVLIHALPLDPLAVPRELRAAGAPTITLSPDWSLFAERRDGRIIVRRFRDGSLVNEIVETAGLPCQPSVPRFSPAGDLILDGSCIWQVSDGALRGTLPYVIDARFRGDRIVGIGCAQGPAGKLEGVCTYDLSGNEVSRRILTLDGAQLFAADAARLAPAGDVVFWLADTRSATGVPAPRFDAWDTSDGRLLWTVPSDQSAGRPVFSPRGDLVLFESFFPTAVSRVADGSPVVTADREVANTAPFALSPDGRLVVAAEPAALRETATGASLRLFGDDRQGFAVTGLAISGDGSLLASLSLGAVGWRVAPAFADSAAIWQRYSEGAANVDVSPDGRLAVLSGDVRTVFSAVDGRVKLRRTAVDIDPASRIVCLATQMRFSADSRFVIGKGYTTTIDVFDTTSFERVATIPSTSCTGGIAFTRDGLKLATSQPSVFEVGSWSPLWSATPPDETTTTGQIIRSSRTDVEFSPDGRRLLTTVCSPNAGGCLIAWVDGVTLPGLSARAPRISAEGHWIVSGGTLLHEPTGEFRTLGPDVTVSIFAPNGDVITGHQDGSLSRFCR